MLEDRLGLSERRACEITGQHRSTRRRAAERPDHVWALDFQFDQTADGRILKLLHVVDEFTREALAIECRRWIDADQTVAVLEGLVAARGTAPGHIRCDNGPELTANALRDWCRFTRAGSAYIEPGSPWQNPYVESFGSRVRDELLSGELFETLIEAQVMVADWRHDYNERRPHSSLGMTAPARFARAWRGSHAEDRPITPADAAQARRTQQDAPTSEAEDRIGPDHAEQAFRAVPLRSPSGLAPRDGGTTTLQAPTNHRLSQQVDR